MYLSLVSGLIVGEPDLTRPALFQHRNDATVFPIICADNVDALNIRY